ARVLQAAPSSCARCALRSPDPLGTTVRGARGRPVEHDRGTVARERTPGVDARAPRGRERQRGDPAVPPLPPAPARTSRHRALERFEGAPRSGERRRGELVTVAMPRNVGRDAEFGLRFALASLAAWRVTHLLAEEDGPADMVVRLRTRAGSGRLGELMDCFYCLSVWVAAPLSLTVARRLRDPPRTWLP